MVQGTLSLLTSYLAVAEMKSRKVTGMLVYLVSIATVLLCLGL